MIRYLSIIPILKPTPYPLQSQCHVVIKVCNFNLTFINLYVARRATDAMGGDCADKLMVSHKAANELLLLRVGKQPLRRHWGH